MVGIDAVRGGTDAQPQNAEAGPGRRAEEQVEHFLTGGCRQIPDDGGSLESLAETEAVNLLMLCTEIYPRLEGQFITSVFHSPGRESAPHRLKKIIEL
ncbi:hypothetical protein Mame01_52830 [Microbispora amethystogenes]|nr:hypothetical protein Mame01_52830 [Microbispora amethystogenes]